MALDESKDTDEIYTINGITYLIDKALAKQAREVKIDFITYNGRSGFTVTSAVNFGGGSCGTSCSC